MKQIQGPLMVTAVVLVFGTLIGVLGGWRPKDVDFVLALGGVALGMWLHPLILAFWYYFDAIRTKSVITRFEIFGIKLINTTKLGASIPVPWWVNSHFDPPHPAKTAQMLKRGHIGNLIALCLGGIGLVATWLNFVGPAQAFLSGLSGCLFFASLGTWINVSVGALGRSVGKIKAESDALTPGFIALCHVGPLEAKRMLIRPRDYPDALIKEYEIAGGRPMGLWVAALRDIDRHENEAAIDKLQAAYIQVEGHPEPSVADELIRSAFATEVCAPRKDWARFDEATSGLNDQNPMNYLQGIVSAVKEYTWGNKQKGLDLARKAFKMRMFTYERGNPHRDFHVDRMKRHFPELAEEFERDR
jgi:hypothetical protein